MLQHSQGDSESEAASYLERGWCGVRKVVRVVELRNVVERAG